MPETLKVIDRGTFATGINCMDGRAQLEVIDYMKRNYNVDHVDKITEPGPVKIISELKEKALIKSIKNRIAISLEAHFSKAIAIIGHHDCAGNPVNETIQRKQIVDSVAILKEWYPNIEVIGLWVGVDWKVNRVI